MAKDKVYCGRCMFYIAGIGDLCKSSKNNFYKDTYLEIQEYRKDPSYLNAKNDCSWYSEKKGIPTNTES